jgi:oligopeptide transport system ATP-binding protein
MQRRLTPIEGLPPDLTEPQTLCPFLPRCRVSIEACRERAPERRAFGPDHSAVCLADLGT